MHYCNVALGLPMRNSKIASSTRQSQASISHWPGTPGDESTSAAALPADGCRGSCLGLPNQDHIGEKRRGSSAPPVLSIRDPESRLGGGGERRDQSRQSWRTVVRLPANSRAPAQAMRKSSASDRANSARRRIDPQSRFDRRIAGRRAKVGVSRLDWIQRLQAPPRVGLHARRWMTTAVWDRRVC